MQSNRNSQNNIVNLTEGQDWKTLRDVRKTILVHGSVGTNCQDCRQMEGSDHNFEWLPWQRCACGEVQPSFKFPKREQDLRETQT